MPSDNTDERSRSANHALNRRNMLLGGTTLGRRDRAREPVQLAQAQQTARRPDASRTSWSSSATTSASATSARYSNGLMGYETPNIDRIAREGITLPPLLWRAVVHRGPRGVPYRPAQHSHRTDQGGISRARRWA